MSISKKKKKKVYRREGSRREVASREGELSTGQLLVHPIAGARLLRAVDSSSINPLVRPLHITCLYTLLYASLKTGLKKRDRANSTLT